MHLPQSVWWGVVPGLLTALGGAYKDTLFEEFEPLKFFRSPVISFAWYLVINATYPTQPVLLKIGLCSMMERLTVETYKALYRPEPGKFKNCSCVQGKCVVQKDRGWFLDRIRGKHSWGT